MKDKLLELEALSSKTPGSKINVIKLGQDQAMSEFKAKLREVEKIHDRYVAWTAGLDGLTREYELASGPEREHEITGRANDIVRQAQQCRRTLQEQLHSLDRECEDETPD
jgi:hypothetical protein